jgi:hypothetical protein
MEERLFIILFFFLSFSFVSASDLGVYPDEMKFDMDVGDKVCSKVIVFSSENISVELEDSWAEQGYFGRESEKHILKSELKGIEISYPEKFSFKGQKEIKICIIGNIAGRFHGLLMARGENVGIGSWMNVNVHESVISGITGEVIYDIENGGVVGMMALFNVVLVLVLAYLLFKMRKSIK